ncbi:MAG: hypothetical protein LBO06_00510 [Bacteroidales bacterium]|jgi:hypothetical protein|nr:hypothetical protein [Bacteroidales bacterium]
MPKIKLFKKERTKVLLFAAVCCFAFGMGFSNVANAQLDTCHLPNHSQLNNDECYCPNCNVKLNSVQEHYTETENCFSCSGYGYYNCKTEVNCHSCGGNGCAGGRSSGGYCTNGTCQTCKGSGREYKMERSCKCNQCNGTGERKVNRSEWVMKCPRCHNTYSGC